MGVELRSDIRPDQEAGLSSSVMKRINCERRGNKHLYGTEKLREFIWWNYLLFLCDLGSQKSSAECKDVTHASLGA